jgi:hypothetical protein
MRGTEGKPPLSRLPSPLYFAFRSIPLKPLSLSLLPHKHKQIFRTTQLDLSESRWLSLVRHGQLRDVLRAHFLRALLQVVKGPAHSSALCLGATSFLLCSALFHILLYV